MKEKLQKFLQVLLCIVVLFFANLKDAKVFALRSVIDFFSLSPDGNKIVFVKFSAQESDIFISDSDGQNSRNITNTNDYSEKMPDWSPDSKKLLFVKTKDSTQETKIVLGDIKNNSMTIIEEIGSTKKGTQIFPKWSPQGDAFTFCYYDTDKIRLKVLKNIFNKWQETADIEGCYGSWSKDGKKLAIAQLGNLSILDLKTKKITNLTQKLVFKKEMIDVIPLWSPKEDKIVFTSKYEGFASELYMIDADGKNLRRLTENFAEDFSVSWSSNGEKLLFSSRGSPGRTTRIFQIKNVRQNAKSEIIEATQYSRFSDYYELYPAFDPNNNDMFFLRQFKNGKTKIIKANSDTKKEKVIIEQ